ncbi:MAG: polysaccharide biosynthesis/export family protein [Muribaculaceae bacterium]|nr:polysaccharide biosynthesis/export family protein [Muribaculaceae bacterium]
MKKNFLWMGGALLLLASCSTPKNITYFQDLQNGQTIEPQNVYAIKVRPGDKLSIMVNTQDPLLSSMFNLVESQNRLLSSGVSTGKASNISNEGRTGYYTVDSKGDIKFPILGELHIGGMKREEVASYIERQLISQNLVKEPVVTVEFANTGVAVLGEVAKPGRYEFNEDKMTILQALSYAGDLKNTGERTNVLVIREQDGKETAYRVDLTKASELMTSPAYYLQQDDMVYVEPNAKAKRETTSAGNAAYSPSFWISVGSVGLTVATLIVTLTKK